MSDSPLFSDSPHESAFYPLQPSEGPPQITQVPRPSDSPELTGSDKLSELPTNAIPPTGSPGPHRSIRTAQNFLPPTTAPSTSSPRGLFITRPSPASSEGHDVRPHATEDSSGQNSSHQRVSFEGNRASPATSNHGTRTHVRVHPLHEDHTVPQTSRATDSTGSRMNRSSDASRPSPAARLATAGTPSSLKKPGHESPPTASAPHSRTTSPIRLFNWSGFHHSHEDAFVPVDPFRLRTRLRRLSLLNSDLEHHVPFDPTCEGNPFCCLPPWRCSSEDRFFTFLRDTRYFMLDTLPRQIYLHLLFRLPSLYFSRIARVYEDAQLSKPDLEHMIDSYCNPGQQEQRERIVRSSPIPPGAHFHPASALPFPDEWTAANVSPALIRFKQSWETFIDSLLREWKTLNLVSALLNSSVFTIFQVLPRISMILIKLVDRAVLSMFQSQTMANDPVIRTAALLSLASAIMSLSYGCIYIVRFGTMRSMYKAARWAEEAARTTTFILWNVWVLLAMPAIWLAWSMIFFIVAILAFVWRYGSSADPASPPLLSPTAAIGPRVAVSALFFVGLLYLAAMVKTLHSYGRTKEKRLFRRPSIGSGMRDTGEPDARGERGGQRGRGMTRNLGRDGDRRDSPRMNGGHGSTKHGREQMETGALSAVMGLGLTGLDEFASPRSSEEMPAEKPGHQTPASV